MPSVKPLDLDADLKNNPEIAALLKVLMHDDLLMVAEGVHDGVPYVIIGGNEDRFTFTKTATGYSVEKTK